MSSYPDIRFIYRVRPVSSHISYLIRVTIYTGIGLWIWIIHSAPEWGVVALVLAFYNLLRAGLLRTHIFIVNADGLTVIKRPVIRLFGSFDFYQRPCIRKVRYRAERRVDRFDADYEDDDAPYEIRYILDLVTTDSQIITLLMVTDYSFDRRLGKRLAAALRTCYEEHLEDEYGNPL